MSYFNPNAGTTSRAQNCLPSCKSSTQILASPLVSARTFVRKMRGGAQSHLIEASDGHHYVVKFQNNPQHRRILINEWLSTRVFEQLRIQTPPIAFVEVTPEFLAASPEVHMQLGSRRIEVEPGWHFGSRYPGHPDRLAVYDLLPENMLREVHNGQDFLASFVADRWLGNVDGRQAIFLRTQLGELCGTEERPLRKVTLAQMIDQGFAFNGPHWDFPDSALQGLYFRHVVYESVTSLDCFEPWLSQIRNFPVEILNDAICQLPPAWVDGDRAELDRLIEKLLKRQTRVADWIEAARGSNVNPFPNWNLRSWATRKMPGSEATAFDLRRRANA